MNKIAGLPVVTSKKALKLRITKADCKKGRNKDPGACAAALALVREVSGCSKARVHLGRTYLQIGQKWLKFRTPLALRSEIVAFDRGGVFEPGDYTLMPLSKSERDREGKAHTLGGPKRGRPGHHRARPHTITGVRAHGANR